MNVELFLRLEPMISNGMSVFQMDKFVINDSITPYRKLRQALVETKARLESITMLDFDLEETILKREKAVLEKEGIAEIDQKLKDVQIRRFDFDINRKQTQRLQVTKEAEFFLNVVTEIAEELGGTDTVVTLLSDPEYHDKQEEEYWIQKLARNAYADFINFGTIGKGVVETLACLSPEQQQAIITAASTHQIEFVKQLNSSRDNALVEND